MAREAPFRAVSQRSGSQLKAMRAPASKLLKRRLLYGDLTDFPQSKVNLNRLSGWGAFKFATEQKADDLRGVCRLDLAEGRE
jgi:hypothetical protein